MGWKQTFCSEDRRYDQSTEFQTHTASERITAEGVIALRSRKYQCAHKTNELDRWRIIWTIAYVLIGRVTVASFSSPDGAQANAGYEDPASVPPGPD